MAMSKKFKAQDAELTAETVHEALQAQFPEHKVELKSALLGKWVQVDQSALAGVAVVVRSGMVNVNPQNGSFLVRFLFGWLLAYLTSGKLVDEVGGYLQSTFA